MRQCASEAKHEPKPVVHKSTDPEASPGILQKIPGEGWPEVFHIWWETRPAWERGSVGNPNLGEQIQHPMN
jgi:hypothetical protein